MRVRASQFEIGNGQIRHRPTGTVFRFLPHEAIFAAVDWPGADISPKVHGFEKREVWKMAQRILRRLLRRNPG